MTALVLAFDTSAAHVTACLMQGDAVLSSQHEDMARGQAERLMPLLEEVLALAGKTWADLDGIGVGIGPGNFTGIRISVSAARGLALGLGIPAVGVSSFEAIALDLPRPCVAVVSAPREQAYLQRFDQTEDTPALLPRANIVVTNDITWVGLDDPQATPALYPMAEAIARVAQTRLDGAARPSPLYIRPADAAPSRDKPPVILDDA